MVTKPSKLPVKMNQSGDTISVFSDVDMSSCLRQYVVTIQEAETDRLAETFYMEPNQGESARLKLSAGRHYSVEVSVQGLDGELIEDLVAVENVSVCSHLCDDGSCVMKDSPLCDWVQDCPDLSDEADCPCLGWTCNNGFCLTDSSGRCDGVVQCSDLSDEADCPLSCQASQLRCEADWKCLEAETRCDHQWDCSDGSDELDCPHRGQVCWPSR